MDVHHDLRVCRFVDAISDRCSFVFIRIYWSSLIDTKSGLFTPNLCAPDLGTSRAVTLRHAASVRPCSRPLYGQEQAARVKEKNKRKKG